MWLRGYRRVVLCCLYLMPIIVAMFYIRRWYVLTRNNPYFALSKTQKNSIISEHGMEIDDYSMPSGKSVTTNLPEHATVAEVSKVIGATFHTKLHSASKTNITQYILPIKTKMGGGSNSQYEKFKNGVIFSLLTNRTLVLLPFFLHGGHVRGITIEHLRSFNDTFDVDMLERLLPLTTLEQYQEFCDSENTKVIGWNISTQGYKKTRLARYERVIDIDLPNEEAIVNLEPGCTLDDLFETLKDEKCIAFATDTLLRVQLTTDKRKDMNRAVAKHLLRTPKIRRAADSLVDGICEGDRFLTYHWRNKTTEQPCYFGHEKYKGHCEAIRKEVLKLADFAVDAVLNLMKKENIECLYIACPLWSLEIVDIFSRRLPRNRIYISEDLKVPPKYQYLFKDYYTLSLLEQEIAYRAAIFIAAGWSNWSDFVSEGRAATGRPTFNIRELAMIPENVDVKMV
ncbi:uncharacterized protein [Ptychodera flava]|uniref:uncharacterized protein n=1 Tax=Ptychodera flava TaxID=63121 RepID=UPI003969CBA2